MQNFSYTKSETLTEQFVKIDELRKELLLIPLSPSDELTLQWDSKIQSIYHSLALNGITVTPEQIQACLTPIDSKSTYPNEQLILSFRRAYDYLYHHWLVSSKTVTTQSLVDFYREVFNGYLSADPKQLNSSLTYIQVNPEHPAIQASLAQILILTLNPFTENNEQFSQLVFLLFMYKYGYDMRRLPVYTEYFFHNIAPYKDLIAKTSRQKNATEWLEYMAQAIIKQLQKTILHVKSAREKPSFNKDFFDLNDRQKAILSLFNQPGAKISNKVIQRKFKVSQITASRDLSKLTVLRLVFPIGKGRSTYYTKV